MSTRVPDKHPELPLEGAGLYSRSRTGWKRPGWVAAAEKARGKSKMPRCIGCLYSLGLGVKRIVRITKFAKSTILRYARNHGFTDAVKAHEKKMAENERRIRAAYEKLPSRLIPVLEAYEKRLRIRRQRQEERESVRLSKEASIVRVRTEHPKSVKQNGSTDCERWLVCYGFEMYECSSLGRLRNRKTGRILKPRLSDGYQVVGLMKDGRQKRIMAHRVICSTFQGPPTSGDMQVNHINRVRSDNRVENLEWCTRLYNNNHWRMVNKPSNDQQAPHPIGVHSA